ncbi:MAG TPA: ClpX C4-type zinc finger protein [Arthrobacter sp.]|nr:ClpX C4-type zinc finger protein [Arthrobacter sp.]
MDGPEGPDPSFCSFCALPRSETCRLVAGPGVAICEHCVQHAAGILEPETAAVESSSPNARWRNMTDQELLDHLPEIAVVGGQVEARLRAWVDLARGRGISWAKIGAALGMTRQSAWERLRSSPDDNR